jgi:hypothetical protein
VRRMKFQLRRTAFPLVRPFLNIKIPQPPCSLGMTVPPITLGVIGGKWLTCPDCHVCLGLCPIPDPVIFSRPPCSGAAYLDVDPVKPGSVGQKYPHYLTQLI